MWPLTSARGDVRKAEKAVADQTGVLQLGGEFEALAEALRGSLVVPRQPRDVTKVVQLKRDAAPITKGAMNRHALVIERQRLVVASLPSQRLDHMVKSRRAALLITPGSSRFEAGARLLLHYATVAVEQGNSRQPDQRIGLQRSIAELAGDRQTLGV